MNVFDLVAKITLDTREYDQALSNAEKSIKKAADNFGGISSKFVSFGDKLKSAGNKISQFGSFITNKITKPALTAATAVAGIFLVKGWSRITQIDEAKAKLRALGNTAEDVNKIMDSALASVKGTAFGMDEAATTAASAVAAGIETGEDLTRYLTSVSDTAAIAGSSMEEMGAIFNKVATSGKAQNDVLGQLADRGIPIYQWLAKEIGVTSDQVFNLAKKGEINLETFRRAVEKNVGGAAKELGNATLTGALSNVWAAVGRVGASFIGSADDANSFAGQILPLIIDLQDWLGDLEVKAKEWGRVFGEVFKAVIQWFRDGKADTEGMSDAAKSAWETIEPILNWLKDLLGKIADAWNSLSDESKTGIVESIIAIGAAAPVLEKVGDLIGGLGGAISGVSSVFKFLGSDIGGFVEILGGWFMNVNGFFGMLENGFNWLDEALVVVGAGIGAIGAVVLGAPAAVAAAFAGIVVLVENLIVWIKDNWDGLVEDFKTVIGVFGDIIVDLVSAISELVSGLGDLVINLWNGICDFFGDICSSIGGFFSDLCDSIGKFFSDAGDFIQNTWDDICNWFDGICDSIGDFFSDLVDDIGKFFSDAADSVKGIWDDVCNFFGDICDSIGGFFGDLIDSAMDWGADLINNFIDGIKSMWDSLVDTVSDMGSAVADFIGFSEPKKGPLSNFHTYAPDMMELFAKGIKDNEYLVQDQLEKSFDFSSIKSPDIEGPTVQSMPRQMQQFAGVEAGYIQNITINSPTELDPSEIARQTRNATRATILQLRMA